MVLSLYFPSALKVVESLQPMFATSPTKVKRVAETIEETLQAYGRCLLAASSGTESGNGVGAARAAESYATWRTRLHSAIKELEVDADPGHEQCVADAHKSARDLAFTVDKVLNSLDVRCTIVSSGLSL